MDSKILKFLAFVQEEGINNVDENKPIWEEYERLYEMYVDHYRECHEDGEEMCEVVEGTYNNRHSHLSAKSEDGTEFDMDGEVWWSGVKAGEVIADFLDGSGKIVLVVCKEADQDEKYNVEV